MKTTAIWTYAALMTLAILAVSTSAVDWHTLTPGALMQWSLALFMLGLEVAFIFLIWLGTRPRAAEQGAPIGINLEKLISEQDGSASFSRFQFLIFTFIVASGYVVQVFAAIAAKTVPIPEIPSSVLALIGISGGSYLVSKGIEKSSAEPAATGQTTPTQLPGEMLRP